MQLCRGHCHALIAQGPQAQEHLNPDSAQGKHTHSTRLLKNTINLFFAILFHNKIICEVFIY